MRASDRDRERVAELLRDGYAEGRLTGDEFGERIEAAFQARTWKELRDLTADLPVVPEGACLPADVVTSRRIRRAVRRMILAFALVIAAGLAGRVFLGLVLIAAVLAFVVVLPFTGRDAGSGRSGPPLPARQHDRRPLA